MLARDAGERRDAGANGVAVEVDGAGSAKRHAAAELCAGQAERIANHPQQRSRGIIVHGNWFSIEGEGSHVTPPERVDERVDLTELGPARPLGIVIGARQPTEGYIRNQKIMDEKSAIFGWKETELFFEKVFEGLAGIGRTARSWLGKCGGDLRGLLIGSGCGVLFDGHAEFVELAGVLAVFGGDALGDGLRTFKLRAGIEEAALLAAVKLGVALGAGAGGVESGDEDRAAIGAAGSSDGANHARGAGTEMIVLSSGTTLRGLAFGAGLLFFFGIAIAAMAVLTIHRNLRAMAWRQSEGEDFALRQTCTL